MGNFATSEENKMFPFDRVQDAIDRWDDIPADGPLCIGLDPAGASERADEIAVAFVRGPKLLALPCTRSKGADELVQWMVGELARWRQPGEVPELRLDVEGAVGAEVLGTLRAYERQHLGTFRLVPISSSDAARKNKKAFATVRDELGDSLEQWCKSGALIDDPLLLEDLAVLEWGSDAKGRNKLIGKTDIKQALGRSPDRYDALALACWQSGSAATKAALQKQVERRASQPKQAGSADRQWRDQTRTRSIRDWHDR
jgi:phage terminase large subunit